VCELGSKVYHEDHEGHEEKEEKEEKEGTWRSIEEDMVC
jgi:hypothetical protein